MPLPAAVSPDVPEVTDLDGLAHRLLHLLPEDDVSIVHGDFKMDNFVRPSAPATASPSDC